jgi:hypothetical protein
MPKGRFLCLAAAVALAVQLAAGAALGGKGHVTFHADFAKHPSTRYGALDAKSCTEELGRRGIAFTPVQDAPGVMAPVRLPRDVDGVTYRTELSPQLQASSPFEVFDCRLVLALSDFSKILRAHDVDEVRIFSAWRPPPRSWPSRKMARRHPGGLAIDAFRFGKKLTAGHSEKQWLEVARDFNGRVGPPPCGPAAVPPSPATSEARELRSIACEAADQHVFTAILTPNYNRAHNNHFHLEVTPEVRWDLVR